MKVSTLKLLNDFTFLIVEDDKVARMMIRQGLKPHSKALYEAEDGLAGLEIFQKNQIDMIITDIHMPKLNGFDMIQEIRALKPEQPFIVMTSYDTDKNIMNSIEDGALSFLRKPLDIVDLQTAILMALAKINKKKYVYISEDISIDINKEIVYKNNEPIFLTFNNHKIFWLLCYNLNRVVTYEMFEDYVYDNQAIQKSTLQVAILRIKKQLKTIKIENVSNIGYILKTTH